ncbi:hypothetical protein GCM10023080_023510 [Streptomyces pseudoechinosporeus]
MVDTQNVDRDVARVVAAWGRIEAWLREHAPVSHEALRRGLQKEDIQAAQDRLQELCGHGFPAELKGLWQLCGGVDWVDVPNDEDGDLRADAFLDDYVLLGPDEAIQVRDRWEALAEGATGVPRPVTEWIPWLGPDNDVPDTGLYAAAEGVGRWASYEGLELDAPVEFSSVASFLAAVADALEHGTGPLMTRPSPNREIPGLVNGALLWAHLDHPYGVPDGWEPIHPRT